MINTIKNTLSPKFLITAVKKARLSVQIPAEQFDRVTDYQSFHKEMCGEDVPLDSLVSAFIAAALSSDRNFHAWKKEKTKPTPISENNPAAVKNKNQKKPDLKTKSAEAEESNFEFSKLIN